MGYVITNGSKFIRVDNRNRVDTTKNFQDAKIFDSRVKANNFVCCLPGLYRNAGYEVVSDDLFLEDDLMQKCNCDTSCEQKAISQPTVSPETINEEFLDIEFLLANVKVFEEFIRDFKEQKDLITKEQARMERVIVDLEHAAELCELDARRGYLLYKMLHDARKRRRACKDAATIISILESHVDHTILKGDNTKMIEGLLHRQYTPREIQNVFEIFSHQNYNTTNREDSATC